MIALRKIGIPICVMALTLALINSASVHAGDEEMKVFLNSEMTGIRIQVNATAKTQPGENLTVFLTLRATTNVHIDRINLEVFGFLNGTDQLSLGNVSAGNFDMNNTLKNYTKIVIVPDNVWGITYGEIRLAYYADMGGFVAGFPNIVNGFPLTLVENTLLKNLEEQVKNLNESCNQLAEKYSNLTETYSALNQTYWDLNQTYTSAQNSLGELDNTRRLTTILAITTVFFLATTVYIILRRPRDYW
ncbi:MAG TPA: hypothetical protein VMW36_00085 [Patescibacteria group bacterium]|nr:hypothetical protein [Patescibacteria group bacterium]